MRTSLIALGLLSLGLAHCAGDRGLLVGGARDGDDGEAGEMNETGGTDPGMSGGNGATANSGGSSGGQNLGGTQSRGGSGAEAGEDPGTGGTGGSDRGGTDSGGTDAGGSAGDAGSTTRGGTGGSADAGMGGVAARGGMDSGGRAGANNAGAGGTSDVDCEALAKEYRELLASAQQCSPMLTVEQCTREMPDDLMCGCTTFVNPMRDADVRRLLELIEKARNCSRICPAIVCPAVRRGVCGADAIVGTGRGRCVAQL
jgi:hypothetical protein